MNRAANPFLLASLVCLLGAAGLGIWAVSGDGSSRDRVPSRESSTTRDDPPTMTSQATSPTEPARAVEAAPDEESELRISGGDSRARTCTRDEEDASAYAYAAKKEDCSSHEKLVSNYKAFAREFEQASLDASRISDAEERELGDQWWKEARDELGDSLLEGDPLEAYVSSVGARVAGHAKRKGLTYRFAVAADDEEPNAFALPGGHVFVTTALVRDLRNEAQLASILGHEVAHVELRHTMTSALLAKLLLGEVNDVTVALAEFARLPTSSEQEKEADALGMRLAAAAGYSPFQAVAAMELLPEGKTLAETFDMSIRTGDPSIDPIINEVQRRVLDEAETMIKTHPRNGARACWMKQTARDLVSDNAAECYEVGKGRYEPFKIAARERGAGGR